MQHTGLSGSKLRVSLRAHGLKFLSFRIKRIGEKAFHGLDKIRFIHLEENKIDTLDRKWIEGMFDANFFFLKTQGTYGAAYKASKMARYKAHPSL